MARTDLLFGLTGRISRLTYFGGGLVLAVVTLVPIVGGMLMLRSAGPWVVPGAALAVAGVVGAIWNTIALTVKRLHDLGLSGANAVWVLGLNVGGSVVGQASEELAIAFGLASIGVGLWLLLTPGQPLTNEYGPIPGSGATGAGAVTA